jgi:hypothetical protein
MDPIQEYVRLETRRQFFGSAAKGLGTAALASLLLESAGRPLRAAPPGPAAGAAGGLPGLPHFRPRARRAIYLFLNGGPAQQDLLDYKPAMADLFDKDLPESVRKGQRLTTMTSGQKRFPLAPSMYKFERHGRCGTWVSELLPWTAKMVDDIAVLKTVHTEAINHDPAVTFIQTGSEIPGRPSLGAWISYGLGSENSSLPAFVVMTPSWTGRKEAQAIYNRLWGAGFLPSKLAGVHFRGAGDPVLFLQNPEGVSPAARRRMLDALGSMNRRLHEKVGDPETHARIAQYEMAFRMQTSIPELTDLSGEPEHVLDLYGPDVRKPGTFARSCLLARRMVERGVRLVQLFHRGWDQHFNLPADLTNQCRDVDRACYALVQDLKSRGLLDDTLVIWGGEFGRTAYCQGALSRTNYGRDHHPRCFTMWMAGGGVKGGIVHGETDDFSYNIARDPVHIRDVNATILHCLGIDHERLSVRHQGLDVRLTGVEPAEPVRAILA